MTRKYRREVVWEGVCGRDACLIMEGQSPSEIDKQFAQAFPKHFRSHLLDLFASLSLSVVVSSYRYYYYALTEGVLVLA